LGIESELFNDLLNRPFWFVIPGVFDLLPIINLKFDEFLSNLILEELALARAKKKKINPTT
jgi:hypothetical protein